MKRTAKYLSKRSGDTDWMLDLIATYDEDHEFFRKDYVKPKKLMPEEQVAQKQMLDNKDGFFDYLPLAKNMRRRYRLNLSKQSKVDVERNKLAKMKQ